MKLTHGLTGLAVLGCMTHCESLETSVEYARFEDSDYIYELTDYFGAAQAVGPERFRSGTAVVRVIDAASNKVRAIFSLVVEVLGDSTSIVSGWNLERTTVPYIAGEYWRYIAIKGRGRGIRQTLTVDKNKRVVFSRQTEKGQNTWKRFKLALDTGQPAAKTALKVQGRFLPEYTEDTYNNATENQLEIGVFTGGTDECPLPRFKVITQSGALLETTLERGIYPLPFTVRVSRTRDLVFQLQEFVELADFRFIITVGSDNRVRFDQDATNSLRREEGNSFYVSQTADGLFPGDTASQHSRDEWEQS